jgi:hypothetical protein
MTSASNSGPGTRAIDPGGDGLRSAKSWAVRYRRHGEKQPRKYTLPGFPSLAAAHKLAQSVLDEVAAGGDPAADKRTALAAAEAGK